MTAHDRLLDSLFRSICEADLEAVARLYADEVEVWNNYSRRTLGRDASLALLGDFLARTDGVRYEVLERRHWRDGAVQRHILHVLSDGREHPIDVCVTFVFAGERIRHIFEYVDGRALTPLGW